MTNPWLKKNPFMSAWLSAANTVANTARGHATVAARRQSSAMLGQAHQAVADFWLTALGAKPAPKPKRKARR